MSEQAPCPFPFSACPLKYTVLPDLETSTFPIHAGPLLVYPVLSSIYFNSDFKYCQFESCLLNDAYVVRSFFTCYYYHSISFFLPMHLYAAGADFDNSLMNYKARLFSDFQFSFFVLNFLILFLPHI
jgi:hypothetical protein